MVSCATSSSNGGFRPIGATSNQRLLRLVLVLLTLVMTGVDLQANEPRAKIVDAFSQQFLSLGEPVSEAAVGSLTVYPDGRGLPSGRGTAREGVRVFERHCIACHGVGGQGGFNGDLVGGEFLGQRTVGSYWPYATTLFDYIRRAMPYPSAGVLDANETYAVVAYLLSQNALIDEAMVMDKTTLPLVVMPARKHFVSEYPLP